MLSSWSIVKPQKSQCWFLVHCSASKLSVLPDGVEAVASDPSSSLKVSSVVRWRGGCCLWSIVKPQSQQCCQMAWRLLPLVHRQASKLSVLPDGVESVVPLVHRQASKFTVLPDGVESVVPLVHRQASKFSVARWRGGCCLWSTVKPQS